ncbi:MAG: ATP-binding cassette domain-containing protein [Candidatus Omnitrophica bacterium]|nr:ATP-binding cassette domain-containing protein [Candidatus Omnitrophota bacterium]
MNNIISVKDISKAFVVKGGFLKPRCRVLALKKISFDVAKGSTLAVIGESGSGKSTLAFILAGLHRPDEGEVIFEGRDLIRLYDSDRLIRKNIQIVFQDPYNTLNPRYTVYDTLKEPLLLHRIVSAKKVKDEVVKTLETVGLRPEYLDKFAHELSGGERQRIAIARAVILKPKILICDEPTSNLDLSIQAQILNLLLDIRKKDDLTVLFITHDISIASFISDNLIVLCDGEIVEEGKSECVLNDPQNSYTQSLLKASLLQD